MTTDQVPKADVLFSEAPASWNTRYITPAGFACQITLRGLLPGWRDAGFVVEGCHVAFVADRRWRTNSYFVWKRSRFKRCLFTGWATAGHGTIR